ncbi:hypothetical protein L873DRAFT_1794466 [Choiromyces venosus 120613-1]|uniref:Uncharacterized protein n=1 Tax=Choiromyces venosus 120613-1 TaxID=1336337 RepID=A0A3N4JE47_9PEZI|nr:hypothetical protein L873DRAFT_1794466 [Choiromyces venosus 120613-1]
MGISLSDTSIEGRSSQQSNIQGNHSGNSGDHNITVSGSTININQGDANPAGNHAKILQCLYTSQYESHRDRVPEPVEGTCTWVTEHPKYKDWWEKETSGLLWLSGDPGCGKSVTASFLVTYLKNQPNAIVCYFFFRDDSEEQRSATFALCAILHQLFSQRKSLCRYAEEAFECKGKRFVEEVDTLWNILVKAVAEGGCGDVICVVDALDECEERTLYPLIHHIACLPGPQTSHIPLKFLVTSRPYHKIEMQLGSPKTMIRLKEEDEVNALTADVTRVIDEGIRELESYWGRPGGLGYLRNLLESSADRTSLWVSLVLGILKDSEDDSREGFINIVTTAPRDLAELYSKILDKSTNPDKARRILNIVVAAARPLTLREMNVAFRIKREHNSIKELGDLPQGFERTVKNLCGLFVRVIDSKIYLVHQTAREFLIKGSLPGHGNWQYTLCPGDSNFIMADICIAYLSLEEFESDPLALVDADGMIDGSFVNYLQKYAFLDYAARHWTDHFRDLKNRQMELFEFTRLMCEAGSRRFLTWLQVYWFHVRPSYRCPEDWTHLMIASWLGQKTVVARLLEEGGDIHARDEIYGTALNLAAIRKDENITRMLLQRNVKVYLYGKGYNILHTKSLIMSPSHCRVADVRALGTIESTLMTNSGLSHERRVIILADLRGDKGVFLAEIIADLWLTECLAAEIIADLWLTECLAAEIIADLWLAECLGAIWTFSRSNTVLAKTISDLWLPECCRNVMHETIADLWLAEYCRERQLLTSGSLSVVATSTGKRTCTLSIVYGFHFTDISLLPLQIKQPIIIDTVVVLHPGHGRSAHLAQPGHDLFVLNGQSVDLSY